MKSRFPAIAVVSFMTFACAFIALSEESEATDVASFSDLKAALGTEGTSTIVLTSDVTADSQIDVIGNKTLISKNGSTLSRSTSYNHDSILSISPGSSLVLSGDLIINGNSNWISNDQSGSFIVNRGNLQVQDNVTIENCRYGVPTSMWGTTPSGGSAVSNYGSMTISGGTITGNSGGDGTIYTSGGKLTITGGSISSNSNRALVLEDGSELQMSGGNVDKNNGGISASGSVFTWTVLNISGGSISNNNSAGTRGAGIYLDFQAKLNLSGGTIEGNSLAYSYSLTGSRGGGIFVGQKSTADLTGGVISGNQSTYGSGICASGDITINGAVIRGNLGDGIYIDQSEVTMVGGEINSNAVYLNAGIFRMTGGKITNTWNAVQIPDSMIGGEFQFGGTAQFDSDSSVSIKVILIEGETQVMSSHSITLAPRTYVEGDQWVSGSPSGLVGLNHSKIDVYPYEGEKWIVDENGCLVNTHQTATTSDSEEGDDGNLTLLIIIVVAIIAIAVTAVVIKSKLNR